MIRLPGLSPKGEILMWMWGLAAALAPLVFYGLHRLALNLEGRGLLYYRKASPKGGGAACFVALQEVVEPGTAHVLTVPAESADDEGASGGPDRPPRPVRARVRPSFEEESRAMRIETERLTLVASTLPLARAELADRQTFAKLLGATVPEAWPPESAADALPLFLAWLEEDPGRLGWLAWYALARRPGEAAPVLVGGGGFLGPPDAGTVMIGYSVLPAFQGRGYATEMVNALARRALDDPAVDRILAQTEGPNPASDRVLNKNGFRPIGPTDDGGTRFERTR